MDNNEEISLKLAYIEDKLAKMEVNINGILAAIAGIAGAFLIGMGVGGSAGTLHGTWIGLTSGVIIGHFQWRRLMKKLG